MQTTLLIARHGNTFGPGDTITRVGITDLPLVASGLAQGAALGRYLKANDLLPDVIFTSELKRAMQTAERAQSSMQTYLPINKLSTFNEIDYGVDENQPEEKVRARIGLDALAAWEKDAIVPPGWQVNPDEIIQKLRSFADEILKKYCGQRILVVTSNGIARFTPHLTEDFENFKKQHSIKISTGALCIFEHETHWQCRAWNIRPEL